MKKMKFLKKLKRFIKFLSDNNGLIGVFIAAWALWFSISNNKEQNVYNTNLYNNIDSLRILTDKMLERQINSEKSQIMPIAFSMKLKPEAQDEVNLYPLLTFHLKNFGHSPGTIDFVEFLFFSASDTKLYSDTIQYGINLLKGTNIPATICVPVFKNDIILSYSYLKCFWTDILTNDIDSIEVMHSFSYKPDKMFIVSPIGSLERNEILLSLQKFKKTHLTGEYGNKYYREKRKFALKNNKY